MPGEKVSAEQQLLTVVDLSTLELAGTVGTHEVSLLRAGHAGAGAASRASATPVPGRIDAHRAGGRAGHARDRRRRRARRTRNERLRAGQYALARVALADDARSA